MIPWQTFDSTEHFTPEIRVPLTDENVRCYIEKGASQLERGLTSPMLELAHERQFAISQLSGRAFDFDVQHPLRMDDALQQLSAFFDRHPAYMDQRPSSPHTDHLLDLRHVDYSSFDLPSFEIPADKAPSTPPSSASTDLVRSSAPAAPVSQPRPTALSISDLVHHYHHDQFHASYDKPLSTLPVVNEIEEDAPILDIDDDPEYPSELEAQSIVHRTAVEVRSKLPLIPFRINRTLKPTRMRRSSNSRSSSATRAEMVQRGLDSYVVHAKAPPCPEKPWQVLLSSPDGIT